MVLAAVPLSMQVPALNRYETPQAPERAPKPQGPPRKLSDIPGVTVTYYDVVGTTIPKLHDWLESHGPRDRLSHKVIPATSSWLIGSAVKFTKSGRQCTLTRATVKLQASATLPRLAMGTKLSAPVQASWNAYVAELEDRHASQLAFVYARLPAVESAIMHSNCDDWQKAAAAAIDRLSEEKAKAFPADSQKLPKLLEASKE